MDTPSTPPPQKSENPPLHVAIVGAGIAGVTLALGLAQRGVSFTIYERASSVREIGAGIGLSPNAERAMKILNRTQVHAAFKRIAAPNGEDYFQWVDGFETDELMFRLHMEKDGFQGCKRADFVEEMLKSVDPAAVEVSRKVVDLREGDDGVEIVFADGSVARADVVVGCDGVRSRVRRVMLGDTDPAAHAGYTGKYCFRALIPMSQAREALGHNRTRTRFMYNGPDAHAITYPVGLGADTVLNVMVAVTDPKPWPLDQTDGRHTAPGAKAEAQAAVASFHPTLRAVIDLLPETGLVKWAIFDFLDHPAPSYAKGAVCLAGDAAHAAGPHLGAGAGFGIEDALVLAVLFDAVNKGGVGNKTLSRAELVRRALGVYNEVRRERTQWLIKATREAVELFQWQDPAGCGREAEAFGREITWRFHRIWNYDVEGMVGETLEKFALSTRA